VIYSGESFFQFLFILGFVFARFVALGLYSNLEIFPSCQSARSFFTLFLSLFAKFTDPRNQVTSRNS
jgi:hypothetical protein